MTFTDQQLKNWAAYEKVRLSAEFNMFDRRAAVAAGLSQDEPVLHGELQCFESSL
jgi:hypothetical protein